ncbi:MAG: HAMP domain-containing protein [Desulfuromonadaceae bacterium]|nr:HAMP domain-containing protein [Desulfuromonadaceae bacterium]
MFKKVGLKVAIQVNLVLLLVMAAGSFYIIQKQSKSLENQLLERGRIESVIGAKLVGKVLEEAIDNEVLSEREAFDTNYLEIEGFDPAKFHTQYDFYLDKAILSILDEFLKDESIYYAIAADRNGYVPTHNTRFQKPLTGDKKKDREGNLTKRMFNDKVGLAAARNMVEGFFQTYQNEADGKTIWDVASPIFVNGKHWGNFRIGFVLEDLRAAQSKLEGTLIMIMAAILLISALLIFLVVSQALKPLKDFTKIASEFADGNVDQPIVSTSKDEIGQLAEVLERLRVSLKMAMSRLSRK